MFENLNKKQKIIFLSMILIMIITIVYYIYSTVSKYNFESTTTDENELIVSSNISNTIDNKENTDIIVHVSGCVKNNTIVSLKSGSRIKDAIDAAGGLTDEADLTSVNLAYILEDGEKIYIPKKGEEISQEETSTSYTSSSSKSSKININTATPVELESIPGIGSSTATKIIDYRKENGKFKNIEDIKNVSGIGDAKFEKMKDYISVK